MEFMPNNLPYNAPNWLPNGHLQTIFPSIFRKITNVTYTRERIATPDADFLDLDWSYCSNNQASNTPLVIVSHGLEGSSSRQYVLGMVRAFNNTGFDALAWNFRSCSGELNKQLRFYHSGATDDLSAVIDHAIRKKYTKILLIGFSLGGNMTLKYLGEFANDLPAEIFAGIVFSVPLHLSSGSQKLEQAQNWLYTARFNRSLLKKVRQKAKQIPHKIDLKPISSIKTLRDFDNHYTSKLHGFADAEDYYARNSALFFLEKIHVETLIVNAKNDPFLTQKCFPDKKLLQQKNLHFLSPEGGGHCGFYPKNYQYYLWSEQIAMAFAKQLIFFNH